MNMQPDAARLNQYITSLTGIELDYAKDYADVWMNGGKRVFVNDYLGLTIQRAQKIRQMIQVSVSGFAGRSPRRNFE